MAPEFTWVSLVLLKRIIGRGTKVGLDAGRRWSRRVDRTVRSHKWLAVVTGLLIMALASLQNPIVDDSVSRALSAVAATLAPGRSLLPPLSSSSVILAADGTVVGHIGGHSRRWLVSQVPSTVKHAVLAAEDATYFETGAFDPAQIERAVLRAPLNIHFGGASTIAQQLAKLNFTDSSPSVRRKLLEVSYASSLEKHYTKEQLLVRYLNQVYLGDGDYGIAAAAADWFGVAAKELTAAQAALLAGKIHSPNGLDPRTDPSDAITRRNTVLRQMAGHGWLSTGELHRSLSAPLGVLPARSQDAINPSLQPFVDLVEKQAETLPALGRTPADRLRALQTGGYVLRSTLNKTALAAASSLSRPNHLGDPVTAVAGIEPRTGAVAFVHSSSPTTHPDVATGSYRPPGRMTQPVLYAAALQRGLDPQSTFHVAAAPGSVCYTSSDFQTEPCESGSFVSLDSALEHGDATVFAELRQGLGDAPLDSTFHLAADRQGGLAQRPVSPASCRGPISPVDLSSPLELASFYATLAAEGNSMTPYAVAEIQDRQGRTVYQHRLSGESVLSPAVAGAVVAATGRAGWQSQQGTAISAVGLSSANADDAWSVGLSSALSVVVWAGDPPGAIPVQLDGGYPSEAVLSGLTQWMAAVALNAGTAPTSPPLPTGSAQQLPLHVQAPSPILASPPESLPVTTPPPVPRDNLQEVVPAILAGSTASSVSAEVEGNNGILVDDNANASLPPASTEKMFTASAALEVLGPSYRFPTQVVRTGPIDSHGTLHGNLVLVTGGDPTLSDVDLSDLATSVERAGVNRVDGEALVDASELQGAHTLPGWTNSDVPTALGPLSALMIDENETSCATSFITDPAPANVSRWAQILHDHRIKTGFVGTGRPGPDASPVASHYSASLKHIVSSMLQRSDNTQAEILTEKLGEVAAGHGTSAAGVKVIKNKAAEMGSSLTAIYDGSGLSYVDRASASSEVALLRAMQRSPEAKGFRESLPVACKVGTLEYRLCDPATAGRVWAKTATLQGSVGLSGYLVTTSNRMVRFAFLLSGVRSHDQARAAEDEAVGVIARAANPMPIAKTVKARSPSAPAGLVKRSTPTSPSVALESEGSGYTEIPPTAAAPGRPAVALSFDDGPDPIYTPQILSVLKQHSVPATFFDIGASAQAFGSLVQAEAASGFQVENHSYDHPPPPLTRLSADQVDQEIGKANSVIQALTGTAPACFRPPYGYVDANVTHSAQMRGMTTLLWTVDPHDWQLPGAETIVQRVLAALRPGAMILLHDGGGDRSQTVAALPAIIQGIRDRGYDLGFACSPQLSYGSAPLSHGSASQPRALTAYSRPTPEPLPTAMPSAVLRHSRPALPVCVLGGAFPPARLPPALLPSGLAGCVVPVGG